MICASRVLAAKPWSIFVLVLAMSGFTTHAGVVTVTDNGPDPLMLPSPVALPPGNAPIPFFSAPDPPDSHAARVTTIDDLVLDASTLPADQPSSAQPATAAGQDAANAIPLPPAVQSGITGLAALGMAGLLRRIRRVLR